MQPDVTGDPILSMNGVRFSFGDTVALRDLTFSIPRGEIFGFLGPSGAGKTTTIKLLTRQLHAGAGDIRLFGEEISTLRQDAFDRVGVLSDNSGLYERLTVYENLRVFADLKRLPAAVVTEALEAVGLADDAKKPAKALSRGMKQRLMLVRATLHRPALLFLDEPTASLDPGTTQLIHGMLKRLNAEGATIFLTTHNMEEADRLCDRVAFLNHGQIVACDTPEALKLAHAKNRVTAQKRGGEAPFEFEKTQQGLRQMLAWLGDDALLTVHSQEPNLEEVFLEVTGRELS